MNVCIQSVFGDKSNVSESQKEKERRVTGVDVYMLMGGTQPFKRPLEIRRGFAIVIGLRERERVVYLLVTF